MDKLNRQNTIIIRGEQESYLKQMLHSYDDQCRKVEN
jgi:hypothetical protein